MFGNLIRFELEKLVAAFAIAVAFWWVGFCERCYPFWLVVHLDFHTNSRSFGLVASPRPTFV